MTTLTAPAPADRVPLKRWLGVAAGTFAIVTVEQLPIGLLTSISGSMNVSEGAAALMVTVPGLVASAVAPILPVLIGRLDRRIVLLALITLIVAANAISALASDFPVLLASRFLAGISIGGFWSLAAGIAIRLVPEHKIAKATALTFAGATGANVLGVPTGTLIGGLTDWRVAFAAVGVLALLVTIALFLLLPPIPAAAAVRLRTLADQFRDRAVRGGVIATFLLVSGHFAAFTFISPVLQSTSGIDEDLIGPLLLAFGVAGIAGNFLAGAVGGHDPRRAIIVISLVLAAILALFPIAGGTPIGGTVLLILWGLAFGGVPVSVQTWILKAAPNAAEAATAINTSMFNLAIALGALLGGIVADNAAVTGTLWAGAVLALLTPLAMRRP